MVRVTMKQARLASSSQERGAVDEAQVRRKAARRMVVWQRGRVMRICRQLRGVLRALLDAHVILVFELFILGGALVTIQKCLLSGSECMQQTRAQIIRATGDDSICSASSTAAG